MSDEQAGGGQLGGVGEVPRAVSVSRFVADLHEHPSWVRHGIAVPARRITVGEKCGIEEPVIVTRNGTVIDGYARWEWARRQGKRSITCLEYDINDEEALHFILQRHRRVEGLNDYVRILLAFDLEPAFKKKAHANQQFAGYTKGSSKLTEADRVDVRKAISTAAAVAEGNVTKVQQLNNIHPEIKKSLCTREVRIHRAWKWRTLSLDKQLQELRQYRLKRFLTKKTKALIFRHLKPIARTADIPNTMIPNVKELALRLSAISESKPILVQPIELPEDCILLPKALYELVLAHDGTI